jgi:hypothetical protein
MSHQQPPYLAQKMDAWAKVSTAREKSFLMRRLSLNRLRNLTEIVVDEAMSVGEQPDDFGIDQFGELVKERAIKRARDKTRNPIVIFIVMQVVGMLIRILIMELYEWWKRRQDEK